jgi:hypothetical protein
MQLQVHLLITYNAVCHQGLNNIVNTVIFLLILGDYHRGMKILKNNAAFSLLLALSEPKS